MDGGRSANARPRPRRRRMRIAFALQTLAWLAFGVDHVLIGKTAIGVLGVIFAAAMGLGVVSDAVESKRREQVPAPPPVDFGSASR